MLDYNGCLPLVESVVNTKVNEKIEDETIQSNKNKNRVWYKQTSLKIFKHYKLKPSFSIIKDDKAKNKVRVGDKPPPQNSKFYNPANNPSPLFKNKLEDFQA